MAWVFDQNSGQYIEVPNVPGQPGMFGSMAEYEAVAYGVGLNNGGQVSYVFDPTLGTYVPMPTTSGGTQQGLYGSPQSYAASNPNAPPTYSTAAGLNAPPPAPMQTPPTPAQAPTAAPASTAATTAQPSPAPQQNGTPENPFGVRSQSIYTIGGPQAAQTNPESSQYYDLLASMGMSGGAPAGTTATQTSQFQPTPYQPPPPYSPPPSSYGQMPGGSATTTAPAAAPPPPPTSYERNTGLWSPPDTYAQFQQAQGVTNYEALKEQYANQQQNASAPMATNNAYGQSNPYAQSGGSNPWSAYGSTTYQQPSGNQNPYQSGQNPYLGPPTQVGAGQSGQQSGQQQYAQYGQPGDTYAGAPKPNPNPPSGQSIYSEGSNYNGYTPPQPTPGTNPPGGGANGPPHNYLGPPGYNGGGLTGQGNTNPPNNYLGPPATVGGTGSQPPPGPAPNPYPSPIQPPAPPPSPQPVPFPDIWGNGNGGPPSQTGSNSTGSAPPQQNYQFGTNVDGSLYGDTRLLDSGTQLVPGGGGPGQPYYPVAPAGTFDQSTNTYTPYTDPNAQAAAGGQTQSQGQGQAGGMPSYLPSVAGTDGANALPGGPAPSQFNTGPLISPFQQQQMLNSAYGQNATDFATSNRNAAENYAANGFSAFSPAMNSVGQRNQLNQMLANTQASTAIPLGVAQTNADYALKAGGLDTANRATSIDAYRALLSGQLGFGNLANQYAGTNLAAYQAQNQAQQGNYGQSLDAYNLYNNSLNNYYNQLNTGRGLDLSAYNSYNQNQNSTLGNLLQMLGLFM